MKKRKINIDFTQEELFHLLRIIFATENAFKNTDKKKIHGQVRDKIVTEFSILKSTNDILGDEIK